MAMSPIEVELLRNALSSIVDESYVALMRSAYSTNIKERKDHSTAIFDGAGRIVAQGDSLPLHLASMVGLVACVRERYGERVRAGDMFISNDPFVGRGSHLPDVALCAPVLHQGRLVFWVGNIAHHADIGGMAAGSMAGGMTEVYQEGLRIPPIKIQSGGETIDEVFDLILLNVRVPRERRGDYMAQIATNKLAVRRCHQLLEKWPIAAVAEGTEAILAATARRMRRGVAEVPDGIYRFQDAVDDDGMGTTSIPICVSIAVKGEEIWFDFAGSGPQVKGNINVSIAGLEACVMFAMKTLIDPEAPCNHGMYDPVHIAAPPDSIVNASFPAGTAGRAQTCQHIIDAIFGALAGAIPRRVLAGSNGSNTAAVFSGVGPDKRYYLYMETIGGGAGARAYKDGTDGVQVHVTNTSNLPIEAAENEYPLLIERYALVEDSGGAGMWRGGLGLHRAYRALGHTMAFSGQSERCASRAWGLFGGGQGASGQLAIVHADGTREILPGKTGTVDVPPDCLLEVITPGAGGYGAPAERSPEKLQEDFDSGKFSADYMAQHYGWRAG